MHRIEGFNHGSDKLLVKKFRKARNSAGRGSDGGGVDGDTVGVGLLVRLGLNTHIHFSCEQGNTRTMLSPPKC